MDFLRLAILSLLPLCVLQLNLTKSALHFTPHQLAVRHNLLKTLIVLSLFPLKLVSEHLFDPLNLGLEYLFFR